MLRVTVSVIVTARVRVRKVLGSGKVLGLDWGLGKDYRWRCD